MSYQPGWRWSTGIKPIAGTELCTYHHLGVTLSGWLRVQMPDGTELDIGPGDVFEVPPWMAATLGVRMLELKQLGQRVEAS